MDGTRGELQRLIGLRGAWLEGAGTPVSGARRRSAATRIIAMQFRAFEVVRDAMLRDASVPRDRACSDIVAELVAADLVRVDGAGMSPSSSEAERYLRGGWLEEYAGLAALEAGAAEVRIGQIVGWSVGTGQGRLYEGRNEIDTIARFGDRLLFVSAKALRSRLDDGDVRHRTRLMEALQEADNLADHFGDRRSRVMLLVTTDLFDERADLARYEQLHGKALALGVELVGLDELGWLGLVGRFRALADDGVAHGGQR